MTDASPARPPSRVIISVVPSHAPFPLSLVADLTETKTRRLRDVLEALASLGHLATFAVKPLGSVVDFDAVVTALRSRLGALVVDVVLGAEALGAPDPAPDFLAACWAFELVEPLGDILLGTIRILGAEHELIGFRVVRDDDGVRPARRAAGEFSRWAPMIADDPATVSAPGFPGEYVLVSRPLPAGGQG